MTSRRRRWLPPLEPVDPAPARALLALVDPAEVEEELKTEALERELRRDRRLASRGGGGAHLGRKCGSCYWITNQPVCPRCGASGAAMA